MSINSNQTANQSTRRPTNQPAADLFDEHALATALADDAGVALILIDADLKLRYANAHAATCLRERGHDRPNPPIGQPLYDLFPGGVAREYAQTASMACDADAPVDLVGMIKGVWRRLTFRPVMFEGQRCILISSPPPSQFHATAPSRLTRRTTRDELGPLAKLTARELEVLRLVGLGLNTTQSAQRLSRSVKTIDGHLLSIRNKIGQLTRTELAALAIESGLTRVDDDEIKRIARQARAAEPLA